MSEELKKPSQPAPSTPDAAETAARMLATLAASRRSVGTPGAKERRGPLSVWGIGLLLLLGAILLVFMFIDGGASQRLAAKVHADVQSVRSANVEGIAPEKMAELLAGLDRLEQSAREGSPDYVRIARVRRLLSAQHGNVLRDGRLDAAELASLLEALE